MLSILAMAAAAQLAAPAANDPGPISTQSAPCGQPSGSQKLTEPPALRSQNGILSLTLRVIGGRNPGPAQQMCYVYRAQTAKGAVDVAAAPTLHLKQGDHLVLTLVNELLKPQESAPPALSISNAARPATSPTSMSGMTDNTLPCGQLQTAPVPTPDPVTGRIYGYHRSPFNEQNVHFHGLNTSPLPPSDDVIDVLLCPRSSPAQAPNTFTYVVDIPRDEPAGMYWYHPHVHGDSEYQVLKALTGAIVVDTATPSEPDLLPNRILMVRDQEPPETGAAAAARRSAKRALRLRLPTLPQIRDTIARAGYPSSVVYQRPFPFGPPDQCENPPPPRPTDNSKNLTVNGLSVPANPNSLAGVPYTAMSYGQAQYWRLANTAADTVLDIEMRVNGQLQPLLVTSRDGVPIVNIAGHPTWQPVGMNHVLLAPGNRVEFYVTATVPNSNMVLSTQRIDTGCVGDDDLARNLVVVNVGPRQAATPAVNVPPTADRVAQRFVTLANAAPARQRVFALTEYQRSDEGEPDFYITELSNPKAVEHSFTMSEAPDIVVKDGTVETWTILNYTQEVHAFHIHQIHFLVQQGAGIESGQGQLLDTVNVPYGVFKPGGTTGAQMTPGAVTLRMDFRDKNIIGTFVYHCHILEHEDNGMMAKIRVVP